jgi:hypothetical protein
MRRFYFAYTPPLNVTHLDRSLICSYDCADKNHISPLPYFCSENTAEIFCCHYSLLASHTKNINF